jgi:hypothetical protein
VGVVARQRFSVTLFPRHGDVLFGLSRGRSRSIYMRIQLTRRMVTVAISSEII